MAWGAIDHDFKSKLIIFDENTTSQSYQAKLIQNVFFLQMQIFILENEICCLFKTVGRVTPVRQQLNQIQKMNCNHNQKMNCNQIQKMNCNQI
jgi:hypothetical protein